jgi:hypothetical protein
MRERFRLRMRISASVAFAAIVSAAVLLGASCGLRIPEIDVEADFITVGFEDHSTMELTRGSTEFEEINDEAIRIYQNIWSIYEELVGPDYLEVIKNDNKFVEIEFIEPVSVTTYTDEGDVYRVFELTSAIIVFTGTYGLGRCVLNGPLPTEESSYWGVYESRRSFDKLEKMVDALLS